MKEKKSFGYVSLLLDTSVENKKDDSKAAVSMSCYCNCNSCNCYVTK